MRGNRVLAVALFLAMTWACIERNASTPLPTNRKINVKAPQDFESQFRRALHNFLWEVSRMPFKMDQWYGPFRDDVFIAWNKTDEKCCSWLARNMDFEWGDRGDCCAKIFNSLIRENLEASADGRTMTEINKRYPSVLNLMVTRVAEDISQLFYKAIEAMNAQQIKKK